MFSKFKYFLKTKSGTIGIEKVKKIIAVLENNEAHKKKPEKNKKKLFILFFLKLIIKKKIEIKKNNMLSKSILNLVRLSINGGDKIKIEDNKNEFNLFSVTKFNITKIIDAIKKA